MFNTCQTSIHLLIRFVLTTPSFHSGWLLRMPSRRTTKFAIVHLVFVLRKQVDLINFLVVRQDLFLLLDLILFWLVKLELLYILFLLSKHSCWLFLLFLRSRQRVFPLLCSHPFVLFILLKHLSFVFLLLLSSLKIVKLLL